ncbi:MAG: rhodanese-like domain-containing protein [Clostridia bacterium]
MFHKPKKMLLLLLCLLLCMLTLSACNTSAYETAAPHLVAANKLAELMKQPNVVVVDMQSAEEYAVAHLPGAVNIQASEIVINVPVKNMLTSAKKLEKLLSEKGIGNDTTIIAYDANRMSAARFFWTMLCYSSDKVLVVDGGLDAIKAAKLELTAEVPVVTPASYVAGEKNKQWLAEMSDVQAQINEPDKNTLLLDVRSDAEYAQDGKIPSSILWDFNDQFYRDGTYKDTQTTQINFLQQGMRPENTILMYCQTSMRAAPVFLQLYDAGYRNIKIYDGAYLEWSSNPNNPIDRPTGSLAPTKKDAS